MPPNQNQEGGDHVPGLAIPAGPLLQSQRAWSSPRGEGSTDKGTVYGTRLRGPGQQRHRPPARKLLAPWSREGWPDTAASSHRPSRAAGECAAQMTSPLGGRAALCPALCPWGREASTLNTHFICTHAAQQRRRGSGAGRRAGRGAGRTWGTAGGGRESVMPESPVLPPARPPRRRNSLPHQRQKPSREAQQRGLPVSSDEEPPPGESCHPESSAFCFPFLFLYFY